MLRSSWIILVMLLIVSVGSARAVIIPDCEGETVVDCNAALVALGLEVEGHGEYSIIEKGLVTRTDPLAGSDVILGRLVDVYESRGLLTPEAYNYQGFIYVLLGLLGSGSLLCGIALGNRVIGGA